MESRPLKLHPLRYPRQKSLLNSRCLFHFGVLHCWCILHHKSPHLSHLHPRPNWKGKSESRSICWNSEFWRIVLRGCVTSVKEQQSCEKQTRWRANNSQLTVSFSLVTDFWKNLDFRIQNPKEFDFWPRISFELLKSSTNLKFKLTGKFFFKKHFSR